MPRTVTVEQPRRHHVIADARPVMAKPDHSSIAKADLRKPEMDPWRVRVGLAIARTQSLSGLSLKLFANAVGRNERQVARWISGEERPQMDAIFANEQLRQPLVIALAEMAGAGVDVEVTVRIRRRRTT